MGTVSSMSKDKTIKINESLDESAEFDYKLSLLKNNKNKANSFQQSETAEKTKLSEVNDLIPYTFEWKEGGKDVIFCASFLEDWNKKETMKFNNDTKFFEITLNVPRGIHQFKFIINGQWVCSRDYPIVNDNNGNINNVIDFSGNNSIDNNMTKNMNIQDIIKKKKKSGKGNNDYNCVFPNQSVVNSEAPYLPIYYKSLINLNYNSNQLKINLSSNSDLNKSEEEKTKKFIDFNQAKNKIENKTFKTIMTIPHEKLSHLFTIIENDNENKYIRSSMTQRNKHKFLTLVYFSPIN